MKINSRRGFILGLGAAASMAACRRGGPNQGSGSPSPSSSSTSPASAGSAASSNEQLPQRRLGRTGVMVSVLGLGGFHIGQKMSESESVALIRRAVDSGINFLDNCWDYNEGQSELRMGKALSDGYRKRAFLMTKIDGRTKQSARDQLEQSLRRLNTDMIDLVQIHEVIRANDPERCFAPDGTMQALLEARQAGKLKYIGFTGHKDPEIHLLMLKAAKQHDFVFDAVQLPLNAMDPHYKSFEKQVLPVLVAENIGVLGMKSMGGGDILKSDVITPEECLRYALSLPTSVVIVGMDSPEVLEKNLKLARSFSPLSEPEKSALLARTEPAAREGKHEEFKIGQKYDGTGRNPHWLEEARL